MDLKAILDYEKTSPMIKQYIRTKLEYEDTIIFYRLGDFYEFFFDDAINMAKVLDLTLTGKDCGLDERAPMCGIPYHAAESYINKLISLGYKVAICEQTTDPKDKKSYKDLVKRDVVRIVTPGTVIDENLLDEKKLVLSNVKFHFNFSKMFEKFSGKFAVKVINLLLVG